MSAKDISQITLGAIFLVGVAVLWFFGIKIFLGYFLLAVIYMFYSTSEMLRSGLNVSNVQNGAKLRAIMKKVGVTNSDIQEAFGDMKEDGGNALWIQYEEDLKDVQRKQ